MFAKTTRKEKFFEPSSAATIFSPEKFIVAAPATSANCVEPSIIATRRILAEFVKLKLIAVKVVPTTSASLAATPPSLKENPATSTLFANVKTVPW